MSVNWQMGIMPDIGQNALAAFEKGRQQRRQDDYQKAAQTYAVNPNEQNFNALLPFASPEDALKIGSQRQMQQEKVKLERQQALEKALGYASLDIMSRPREERPALWDAYAQQFSSIDPTSAQSVGQYNEQAVMAILARQGLIGEYQKATQPRIMSVEPGGYVARMNRDGTGAEYIMTPDGKPVSGSEPPPPQMDSNFMSFDQFQSMLGSSGFKPGHPAWATPVEVKSQDQYQRLPKGKSYIAPDGSKRVKQ